MCLNILKFNYVGDEINVLMIEKRYLISIIIINTWVLASLASVAKTETMLFIANVNLSDVRF